MANLYEDRWISCGDDGIRVRWYYLWGTKRIPYPKRATKQTALVLDLGRFVRPFLSPEDPDAFERVVRERSNLSEGAGQTTLGPIV
jgi:hypothetical protein